MGEPEDETKNDEGKADVMMKVQAMKTSDASGTEFLIWIKTPLSPPPELLAEIAKSLILDKNVPWKTPEEAAFKLAPNSMTMGNA